MKNFEKEIRQCYASFQQIVVSDSYQQYKIAQNEKIQKSHFRYVAEHYPEQIQRTDTYEESILTEVKVYDTLTNTGATKLIQKLYSLPKRKFNVRNRYKRPTYCKHYDYVYLQLAGIETDSVADIEFLDDDYIKNLSIGWCHIDSFSVYVEYAFTLKKCLPKDAQREFVINRMSLLNKNDHRSFYVMGESQQEKYSCVLQLEEDLLLDIFRHYVTSLFYSEHGRKYPLNCLAIFSRQEPIDIDRICLSPFHSTWCNAEEKYILIDRSDNAYYLCAGENRIPNFSFFHLISRYGNAMYFALNGWNDLKIIQNEFSKYSTHRRHIRKTNLIGLLNRLQGLRESQNFQSDDKLKRFDKDWIGFGGYETKDFSALYSKYIAEFKRIYEDNFLYFQTVAELDMAQTNQWISLIAIIIAVLTLILTV